MKILYLANFTDKPYKFTNEIKKELEQHHSVTAIDDSNFEMKEVVEKSKDCDMFLFHHGGISTDSDLEFQMTLMRLKQLLEIIKCKKVLWFPEKVWMLSDQIMEEIVPMVDSAYFNDDTWVRRHKYKNTHGLHFAAEESFKGEYREEYDLDVAFVGNPSAFRKPFIDNLRQQFGNKFKVFTNVWDEDFADLCFSAKIIFVPNIPFDDFCWCNRIYNTLANGGFMVHPRFYGLGEQGFKDGVHYVGWKTWHDLLPTMKEYIDLPKERKKIAKAGRDFVLKNHTYKERVKELCELESQPQ